MMDPMKQYNSYLSAASSIYGSSPSPSSAAQQPPTSTTTAGGLLNPSASPTATASTPTSDSAGGGGGTGGMKESSPVSASSGFQQQYNTSLENSSRSSPYGINTAEGGGAKTSYSADSLSRSYFDSMQRAAQAAYTSSASTASDNNGLSNGRAPSADSSNNDVAKDSGGSLGDQQLANNFSSHQQAAALQVSVRIWRTRPFISTALREIFTCWT